jgi:hypothetical protein
MKTFISLNMGTLLLISSLHAANSQDIVTLEEYSADRESTEIELGRFGAEEKSFGFSSTLKMGYGFEYLEEPNIEETNINLSVNTLRLTINYMW